MILSYLKQNHRGPKICWGKLTLQMYDLPWNPLHANKQSRTMETLARDQYSERWKQVVNAWSKSMKTSVLWQKIRSKCITKKLDATFLSKIEVHMVSQQTKKFVYSKSQTMVSSKYFEPGFPYSKVIWSSYCAEELGSITLGRNWNLRFLQSFTSRWNQFKPTNKFQCDSKWYRCDTYAARRSAAGRMPIGLAGLI